MPSGLNAMVVSHAYGLDNKIVAEAIAWSTAIVSSRPGLAGVLEAAGKRRPGDHGAERSDAESDHAPAHRAGRSPSRRVDSSAAELPSAGHSSNPFSSTCLGLHRSAGSRLAEVVQPLVGPALPHRLHDCTVADKTLHVGDNCNISATLAGLRLGMLHHVGIEVAPEDVERAAELFELLGSRGSSRRRPGRVHLAGTRGDPGPPDAGAGTRGAAARSPGRRRPGLRGDAGALRERGFEVEAAREHWGAPRARVLAPAAGTGSS